MKQSPKVLIVEDDQFVLKVMVLKFTESGFTVKQSVTAEGALTILKRWLPDAIILDILLPGIDGYAFLKIIRTDTRLKNIPVIISSNLDEDKDSDIKVSEYVVKSNLDLDDLVKKVRKHLG